MKLRICWVLAIVAFALVPGHPRAANLTALVSFCALANCADGMTPQGGVIADAHGNLFGTTGCGGAHNGGTVFEIRKTRRGYASTPTILVSFCALANCADGLTPGAALIADAEGNLFGTTFNGGANSEGVVFEITDTGFVARPVQAVFAGPPGKSNCFGNSVATLARQHGGLNAATAALGFSSVNVLEGAIMTYCEGSDQVDSSLP